MFAKTTRVIIFSAIVALMIPAIASAGDVEAGKLVFDINCASCHGAMGAGDGIMAAALPVKPRDFSAGVFMLDADGDGTPGSDADLKMVISEGAAKFGGSPLMAQLGHLGDADIANVIAFIRTLKK